MDIIENAGARAPTASHGQSEFRKLLEKLPAAAYTCDASGLITYFNPKALDIWGRAPRLNDPADRYCGSFKLFAVDGSPIPHERCWMALALKHRQEYNGREIMIERPDGRRITALAHANPIRDELGRLCGAVNVLVDISDRKAAEETLRTTSRYKDEFLATLAHELRNPLAPLRNAVQILNLRVPRSSETTCALEVIERQLRQMTRLIDDLMDVSRITRNRLELQRRAVKLADVVHAALETSQPLIESGGHRFTLQMPGEQITIEADATRLSQAISNLLNNGAKFTPRGGHITLRVERDGDDAILRVRDTGIGIAPEALPRIFEMFAQADQSLERTRSGLGVGLTLVRRLVEMHGGSVQAHSEGRDRGAEFVIRLPALRNTARAPTVSDLPHAGMPSAALRILVVDDNIDSAATMAELLRMQGHEVRTAHDGLQAVEEMTRFRADAAILDIGMPKMNGYTVAKRIREICDERQPLLIAVTGWGQDEDRHRSRAAGFDHHLVKPVDPAALCTLLGTRAAAHTLH
ncbi:MAG TPA: ATP-binding protein [Burkholderiales bacterium]|nr:ATP-binding protein [Burkholderiales bacterium]